MSAALRAVPTNDLRAAEERKQTFVARAPLAESAKCSASSARCVTVVLRLLERCTDRLLAVASSLAEPSDQSRQ
jgi:hypothetical protein